MLLVVGGRDRDPDEVVASAEHAIRSFEEQHDRVIGVVANRVIPPDVDSVAERLAGLGLGVSAALPESAPTAPRSPGRRRAAPGRSGWAGADRTTSGRATRRAR